MRGRQVTPDREVIFRQVHKSKRMELSGPMMMRGQWISGEPLVKYDLKKPAAAVEVKKNEKFRGKNKVISTLEATREVRGWFQEQVRQRSYLELYRVLVKP